ncbi:hypothetical protein N9T37_00250 [bacterium]|nr:hypothetical protein [bacterium]
MGLKFTVVSAINFSVGIFIYYLLWLQFTSPMVYFLAYPLGILFNYFTYRNAYNISHSVGSLVSFVGTYVLGFFITSILYLFSLAVGCHPVAAYFVSILGGLSVVFIWVLKKRG